MKVLFRFWLVMIFASLPFIAVQGVVGFYVWEALDQRLQFILMATIALGWFILFGAITYLYRWWVDPVRALSRGVEIIDLTNRLHEIDVYSEDEIEETARRVQSVGAKLEQAYSKIDALVEKEVDDISKERESLSQALDSMGVGVVVVNRDGLIVLCNREADHQLDAEHSVVGHSIFKYLDRPSFSEAMVNASAEGRVERIELSGESFFVSPFIRGGEHEGFVITLWPTKEATKKIRPRGSRPEFYDFDLLTKISVDNKALDRPLTEALIVSFDTETTGLHPSKGDQIISIGGVRIRNGNIRQNEVFESLVDPQIKIPEYSIQFHHITDDMVEGQPKLSTVLPKFIDFADNGVLLGHNLAFDLKFINISLEQSGEPKLRRLTLDTLLLSYVLHDHYDDHNLKELAERLGVKVVGLHTALGDALTTAEIFLKLLPLLKERGVETVGQAVEFSSRAYSIRKEQGEF